MTLRAIGLGSALLVGAPAAWPDPIVAEWQPAKTKNGIEVSTAEIEGSRFLAFKAHTVIEAALEDVLAAITDHSSYPEWYDNCLNAELVEWVEPDSAVVRIVIKTPFPLANRDAINQVTITRQGAQVLVDLTSRPTATAEVRGLVRMTTASGSWQLRSVAAGTEVTHTYHADPLARVPAWLVNRFVVDGPINSLTNLKKRLQD